MKNLRNAVCIAGLAMFAGAASAAEVLVTSDIAVSTTWTSNNTYNLQSQIYVLPGATLTIEPGTRIASTPTVDGSGSLAVTRGARIMAVGTKDEPIIFTSTADDGTWRAAANEWGNLTIMGNAYISNSFVDGNVPTCDPDNISPMEGLVPDFENDPNTIYGGGDDDDNSGCLSYVSIRYGGRVVGLTNELNGLSLGGVGRGTDIDHVEIMNNVDDGIEIWGGTVNLKYVSIWNVGDDSLDIDQGWRGKAQFGLIVQGYSVDASQGSGVGDNCIETDGAEDSNAQPVTTGAVYNFTVIGQPAPGAGDGLTAWRDNARMQYHNCIFMDGGERLVRFDNVDGDGSQGYGFNGTLTWDQTWNTSHSQTSTVNACDNPDDLYTAQSVGRLADMRDNVFFRNLASNAYNIATDVGVFAAGKNNVLIPGFEPADAPIQDIQRGGPITLTVSGILQLPVISLDPRAKNEAMTSVNTAPDDGFFCEAQYRGGFDADENWLCGWTASDEFGFIQAPPGGCASHDTNRCPKQTSLCDLADFDGSGGVGTTDLLALLAAWGTDGDGADLAAPFDVVNTSDLLAFLTVWGDC